MTLCHILPEREGLVNRVNFITKAMESWSVELAVERPTREMIGTESMSQEKKEEEDWPVLRIAVGLRDKKNIEKSKERLVTAGSNRNINRNNKI